MHWTSKEAGRYICADRERIQNSFQALHEIPVSAIKFIFRDFKENIFLHFLHEMSLADLTF